MPRHEKTRKLEINRDDLETNWLVRRRNEFEVKIYRPKVLRIIAGDDIVTLRRGGSRGCSLKTKQREA